ncbi:MAG: cytochrome c biogenesis protein ResB [Gammaproteobacteria bacterium]|nr:cytochrome c biogenesis protein ResB [Gammaproteobacteria bacterium]
MMPPATSFQPRTGTPGEGGLSARGTVPGRWLQRLASLKLTLVLFGLLLLCVGLYYASAPRYPWLISLPLLLFSANLFAAIATHPTFRRQLPLLTFHLALLALITLLAASRLSYLDGELEIAAGERFSGQLTAHEAGPLHRWGLDQTAFRLDDFSIEYQPGPNRDATRSTVTWRDAGGELRQGVVGDHRPLVLNGYRFYTTHNKGFAPAFVWQPDDGRPSQRGLIHLPAYPIHEHRQAQEWTVPATDLTLWTQLQFDEVIIAPDRASTFHAPRQHTLIVRHGESRHELQSGEGIALPGGRLIYQELRTWMGFKVTSDWTLPWLFAAGVIAMLSLGWHYWRKCASQPWLRETQGQKE